MTDFLTHPHEWLTTRRNSGIPRGYFADHWFERLWRWCCRVIAGGKR